MKNLLLFVFAIPVMVFSQPLTIQWQKCLGGTLGDDGYGIKQMADGNYLTCGGVISNDGDVSGNHSTEQDGWVVKLDSNGDLLWQRCYGGSLSESFYSLELTVDGGFVVAGYGGSIDGDVTGTYGSGDDWIVNCDSSGNILWQKCLGGSNEESGITKISRTFDRGYIIISSTASPDHDVVGLHDTTWCTSCWDDWVVKLDSVGNIEWSRCYGGYWWDHGYSIVQTRDSGYVFVGSGLSDNGDVQGLHGATNGYGFFQDYWVVKINSTGMIEWQKCLGGTADDVPFDISNTDDGGYILTGTTLSNDFDVSGNHSSNNYVDAWIVKLDSSGGIQWQKCLGGSWADVGIKIMQTPDGGFLSLNYSESQDGDLSGNQPVAVDVWLVKLDPSGNIQWQQCLGGSLLEGPNDMCLTSDGGLVYTGLTNSNDGDVSGNHGDYDVWVVKLSALPDGVNLPKNPITDFSTYLSPSGSLKVNFFANGNEKVLLQFLDITGRSILQQSITVTAGLNNKEIQTAPLARGIYLVRLESQNGSLVKKVSMN